MKKRQADKRGEPHAAKRTKRSPRVTPPLLLGSSLGPVWQQGAPLGPHDEERVTAEAAAQRAGGGSGAAQPADSKSGAGAARPIGASPAGGPQTYDFAMLASANPMLAGFAVPAALPAPAGGAVQGGAARAAPSKSNIARGGQARASPAAGVWPGAPGSGLARGSPRMHAAAPGRVPAVSRAASGGLPGATSVDLALLGVPPALQPPHGPGMRA